MKNWTVWVIITLYILSGVLADGMWVGSFKGSGSFGENSVRAEVCSGLFAAIAGPIGLFAMIVATGAGERGICYTEAGCAALRNRTAEPK